MNAKPNIPDAVIPGKSYSFWTDMKVNGWLLVAGLTTAVGDRWFSHHAECPFGWRAVIALMPLPASLLWIRSVARWIRGMDELHRRMIIDTCLFATTWTIVVTTVLLRFAQAGILNVLYQPIGAWEFSPAKGTLTGCYALPLALLFFFYLLGYAIFNRRYK